LSFLGITELVEAVMDRHQTVTTPSLSQILSADQWARAEALKLVEETGAV
jgi:1-deoxy-D-xylulose 5-phosphate reductoisomerase